MLHRNVTDRALFSPESRPQVVRPDEVADFPDGSIPSPDLWEPVTTKGRKAAAEKE